MTSQQNQIIDQVAALVKAKFEGEGTGHDWWHIYRVYQLSLKIAKSESADVYVISLAALLHDIADHKFNGGDENAGPKEAERILLSMGVEQKVTERVQRIISEISFKGANVKNAVSSTEAKIVQDADRLDAIGAIGVARTFAYGGFKGQPLYEPGEKTVLHDSFEAYKNTKGSTINHFHEKLLLLKDRMNTVSGRQLAEQRHAFLEQFLTQFHKEWDTEA